MDGTLWEQCGFAHCFRGVFIFWGCRRGFWARVVGLRAEVVEMLCEMVELRVEVVEISCKVVELRDEMVEISCKVVELRDEMVEL